MKNSRISITVKAWASRRAGSFMIYCAGVSTLITAVSLAFYLNGG